MHFHVSHTHAGNNFLWKFPDLPAVRAYSSVMSHKCSQRFFFLDKKKIKNITKLTRRWSVSSLFSAETIHVYIWNWTCILSFQFPACDDRTCAKTPTQNDKNIGWVTEFLTVFQYRRVSHTNMYELYQHTLSDDQITIKHFYFLLIFWCLWLCRAIVKTTLHWHVWLLHE